LIPDFINHIINHRKRHKKPLPRPHWIAEAILNSEIKLCISENAMKHIFQPHRLMLNSL